MNYYERIIMIGAGKGGVGKTALAREFGARMAMKHRVTVVDCDPQANMALVLGQKAGPGLSNVLLTDDDAANWLVEVPDKHWNPGNGKGKFYLLPGDESTSVSGARLLMNNAPLMLLRDKLAHLIQNDLTDYIILDTAPSISPFSPWVFAAAHHAVIPTGGALEGIKGIVQTEAGFAIISKATHGQQKVNMLGIVPTQIMPRTNLHRKNWEALHKKWPNIIWPIIEYRITWQYATQYGQALTAYAPGTQADEEAQAVYEAFENSLVKAGAVA